MHTKKFLKGICKKIGITYSEGKKTYREFYEKGKDEAQKQPTVVAVKVSELPKDWGPMDRIAYAAGFNFEITKRIKMSVEKQKEIGSKQIPLVDDFYAKYKSSLPISVVKECWSTKLDTVEKCSKSEGVQDIVLSMEVMNKIVALMNTYKKIEWLAFLFEENGIVTRLEVPKQKVSSGSVHVNPGESKTNECGVIHSHHNLGIKFSGTDDEFLNQTYQFSIVAGIEKGSIWFHAVRKIVVPCGAIMIKEADVDSVVDSSFVDSVKSNIEEEKPYEYVKGKYVDSNIKTSKELAMIDAPKRLTESEETAFWDQWEKDFEKQHGGGLEF